MPLIIPPPPAQSVDALRAVIPSILHGSSLAQVAPRLAAALSESRGASPLSPAQSYRVYTLGLSDLASAASNGFRAAKLFAWRHILASNGEVITADVSVDPSGVNHRFTSLSSDPFAPGTQSALDDLAQDPVIANASYDVSLLQVPALGVRALWLRDPSGKSSDIIVPVAPVRTELAAGRRYQLAEFTDSLKDAAAKILSDDDPRKGSG